jgi:hypothetical protein
MTRSPGTGRWRRRSREALLITLVWSTAFLVFRSAPVHQLHDSKYTMLLAENLLVHRDFDLARYDLPSDDYHLRTVGAHRYYFFPAGPAVLSVPFVAAMHARKVSAVRADGSYDERGELALDARLAALLMAAFAVLAYATARLLLPAGWSLGVAAVAAFGTQVLSTASRSVWSDTWGILLVGAGVFLLLHAASRASRASLGSRMSRVSRGAPASAVLLATTLGLAYVVRPTNALAVAGVGVYLLVTERRAFSLFAVTIALIAGLFVAHSWHLFHAPLPPYFAGDRLDFRTPWVAIAGNLVSPSRGLLVYVPAVIAVGLTLARHRRTLRLRGLLGVAAFVVVAHFVAIAGFWDWWGGHSYGPRLTTSLVPWFVLLAVLAVDAARDTAGSHGTRPGDATFAAVAGVLCAASVAMNAVGACSFEADRWNITADNINSDTARLWSWRRPQFLALIVPAPVASARASPVAGSGPGPGAGVGH